MRNFHCQLKPYIHTEILFRTISNARFIKANAPHQLLII